MEKNNNFFYHLKDFVIIMNIFQLFSIALKPTEIYDTSNLIANVSILDNNVISFYVSQKLKMEVKLKTKNVS